MSDAASDEPILSTEDGVTVEKTYEPEDFPVPAIAFTITSERDEAISVRMADTVPEDIPTEDIGFHPKYGAEFWDVEGSTIVFTREFEPHEEYVTVYGLRGKDAAEVDRFLTEPELTSVDPIQGASGDVVRDVIGHEESGAHAETDDVTVDVSTSEPEPDHDDESDGDLDIDLPDPDADDDAGEDSDADDDVGEDSDADDDTGEDPDTTDADAATETDTDSGEAGVGAVEPEATSHAAALAAEIRDGEVDDADLADLRDALGVTADASTDARVDHLQSTVTDLEAYADALEEFLDEEGDAQSILSDVREDYESATERLDDLEGEVARIDALERDVARIDDLEDEVARIDDLEDEVARIDDLERDVARIDDLEEEVARIDDLEGDLGALRDDVTAVEEDVAEATEDRLVAMEADIEALEEELAEVAEMRDRLANALGGLGGSAGGEDADDDSDDADADDDTDAGPEINPED